MHSLVRDYSQFSRVTEYAQSNQGLCIVKSWAMQSLVSLLTIHSLVGLPSMHSLSGTMYSLAMGCVKLSGLLTMHNLIRNFAQFSRVTEYAQSSQGLCKV